MACSAVRIDFRALQNRDEVLRPGLDQVRYPGRVGGVTSSSAPCHSAARPRCQTSTGASGSYQFSNDMLTVPISAWISSAGAFERGVAKEERTCAKRLSPKSRWMRRWSGAVTSIPLLDGWGSAHSGGGWRRRRRLRRAAPDRGAR